MASKFQQILTRSGKEVSAARAERFARRGLQAITRKIMELEAKRDAVAEAIDASLDINTSNDRNSINAIEAFDADTWANNMVENRIKLRVLNEKLDEANKVFEEYFSDVNEETGEVS